MHGNEKVDARRRWGPHQKQYISPPSGLRGHNYCILYCILYYEFTKKPFSLFHQCAIDCASVIKHCISKEINNVCVLTTKSRAKVGTSKMYLNLPVPLVAIVVDSLFIVNPIVLGFCVKSLFSYAVLSSLYNFTFILMRKRELVALLKSTALPEPSRCYAHQRETTGSSNDSL